MIVPTPRPVDAEQLIAAIARDVRTVVSAPAVLLGQANPPSRPGVYILSVGGEVTYVGEAKGKLGLRDRLLNKHLSGDDGHAIQRAFMTEFPDRVRRREHIRQSVAAQWIEISEPYRVSTVERLLICLLQPKWNRR